MLVFISDLHFTDGTAGKNNPPPEAFGYFFDDLVAIASKDSNAIREVQIVLLGDIFDLLRTENWFGHPVNERPWATEDIQEGQIELNAQGFFQQIKEVNQPAFAAIIKGIEDLSGRCQEVRRELPPPPVKLLYLAGNHDRLCNKYSSLRTAVCNCLGISADWQNPADKFPQVQLFPEYAVCARHGHEFDAFNYERIGSYGPIDYEQVPIGDPITTELLARLPYELYLRLLGLGFSPEESLEIKIRFQDLENVRPLGAVIQWLLYRLQGEERREVQKAVEDTLDQIIDEFNDLEYVRFWYERHDKVGLDDADKLKLFLRLLKLVKLDLLDELLTLLGSSQVQNYFFKDTLLAAAPKEWELSHLDGRYRYIVYGHTHDPLVAPVRTLDSREHLYLNTGTWRSRFGRASQDGSFISWKNMTYVIFYREDERTGRKADFETWTGTMK